jgi:predicted P-loop ATPase
MTVSRNQRHTRQHRCPICQGADEDPRGKDKRCSGFTSSDGWAHCSREEHAGDIEPGPDGLYAHRPTGPCKCGQTHAEDTRQRDNIEEVYPYLDERGTLLFEVVRFFGKQFRQRKPDGAGGHVWKLEGVRRVLYHLPELLKSDPSKVVYLPEGERDVHALEKVGCVATTNSGGAKAWRFTADNAVEALKGRDVVILADNDEPGRKRARDAESSLRGVAKSIKVLAAPAPHKDVRALLEAGGTVADLVPLKSEPKTTMPDSGQMPEVDPHVRIADDWRGLLLTRATDDGEKIIPNLSNVIVLLRHHPDWRGVLGWNSFAERIEFRKVPRWSEPVAPAESRVGALMESDFGRIVDWCARAECVPIGPRIVELAIPIVAEANEFHPVREWLNSLKWDGIERLPSWLATYCGSKGDAYTATVGTRWMISAVARVFEPGCQVDTTLIFETRLQGTGKNSAFRALVPDAEWFSETGIVLGDKDSYQCIRGKWLYLFDELDSLSRADVTRVKGFLTSARDHYRPSYGHVARDFLRQTVFCGTTNKDHYLLDTTGNRRFWPVKCASRIDYEGIARDRGMLWAEAVVRYRRGEKWYADTAELRALCEAEQADRVQQDDWQEFVAQWLANPDREVEDSTPTGKTIRRRVPFVLSPFGPSTAEILEHALGKPKGQVTRADTMRAAEVLRTLGCAEPVRRMCDGVRTMRYPFPAVPTPEAAVSAGESGQGGQGTNEPVHTTLSTTAQPKTRPPIVSGQGGQGYLSCTREGTVGGTGALGASTNSANPPVHPVHPGQASEIVTESRSPGANWHPVHPEPCPAHLKTE